MSEIKRRLRCYKCGTILQDVDTSKPGYISSFFYNSHESDILLCNSCFQKVRFNEQPKVADLHKDYYEILNDAKATDSLIILVLDIFSFEGNISDKFKNLLKGCNVVAIANKRDLLDSNIEDKILIDYVSHRLRAYNIPVNDVLLTSHNSLENFDNLVSKLNGYRKRHDIYLIGFPNSGKTTLANIFLKNYKNKTHRMIQTMTYPNTDLRVVQIPLDRTSVIYDVPGFLTTNCLPELLEKSVAEKIKPKKAVLGKPILLNRGTSFTFGGLARVDLLEGSKTGVKVYCGESVEIKTYGKLVDIDNTFYKDIKKEYLKPISKKLDSYEKFDIYDITVSEEGSRDIGILGLGWFSFIGNKQTFRITLPKGIFLYTTRSKINYVK